MRPRQAKLSPMRRPARRLRFSRGLLFALAASLGALCSGGVLCSGAPGSGGSLLGGVREARADDEPLVSAEVAEKRETKAGGAGLQRCLRLADGNHPNLLVARAKLEQVRAQLDEAHFAPFMNFSAFGGLSLAPTVRGNNVFSPNTDASLTTNLGVAWKVGINGVLPLWTFGKISNLWDAAEANVRVNQAAVDIARDAVRFDVRRAYLGLQLARDSLYLLDYAIGQLSKALSTLETQVEADEADPIDLAKMHTFSAELYAKQAEAERYERIANSGLAFYTGVKNLKVRDEPIKVAPHHLAGLQRYLNAARVYRPDVAMAHAGLAARRAQVRLSQSNFFPDLGLAVAAGLTAAPEVADGINPFATDGANVVSYGAALVFQWKLDFLPKMAKLAYAEAQLQEMLALDQKALGGVAAEVEGAYAEVIDWHKRLMAYRKAASWAKKWLVEVNTAVSAGTMEEREVVDPAKAWVQQRFNMLEATMEYNMALAKLAKVTGWDAIAPGG
jgi:outer membrane protein TolC